MIILTLFGTTTGLELQNFLLDNSAPALKFEEAWIGVTPGQVTLLQDKAAFVVFRRSVGRHLTTWVGVYRQAREMGYDRPGGFYGAGAWIIDNVADARILTESLFEMANQIQSKTMNGDRFVRKLVEARSEFLAPQQQAALLASLTKATSGFRPEGESTFIVEGSNAIDVIEWAQRAPSASIFSKMVIGEASQAPSAGQNSALKVFASHSLAIDAAYNRLSSESRNEIYQAKNQIEELSRRIEKITKDNLDLNDKLKNTRSLWLKAESDRIPSPTSANHQQDFHISTDTPSSADIFYKDIADGLWQTQTPTQMQPAIPQNDFVQPPNAYRSGPIQRLVTPADRPGGQVKPEGAKSNISTRNVKDDQSEGGFGRTIIPVVVCIILVIVISLIIYGIYMSTGCPFYKFQCIQNPPQQQQDIE